MFGQGTFRISGVVTSAINSEPLEYMVILVNGSSENGSVTDSLGYYELDLPKGQVKLTALWIGYEGYDTTLFVNKPLELNFRLTAKCEYSRESAQSDISKGRPKLLIDGSISVTAFSKEDDKFAHRYKIRYYNLGDSVYALECIEMYNAEVFQYLDNKYGKSWREDVRPDVIDISE